MGKREFKDTIKRVRRLCCRCDLGYELPPKRFGIEQTILLRRLELPPKDDFALCFSLSEGLKYLESFYDDVRAQQKAVRKEDKDLRSQALDMCKKLSMSCVYTKRTRLNPPSYRFYDPVDYEQALGPKLSVDQVQNLFKIKRSDLSNTALPSRR